MSTQKQRRERRKRSHYPLEEQGISTPSGTPIGKEQKGEDEQDSEEVSPSSSN